MSLFPKASQPGAEAARSPEPRFSPCGAGLLVWRARVATENVAWLRYVLEAQDGLAFMHSDGSGVVLLLCPVGRTQEMRELMQDLLAEGCLAEILPEQGVADGRGLSDVI